MNGLSLRELEALRAMVIAGTTKSAAITLGISQPTVSRAIAQLESRLGVLLFTRNHGRLRPTAEAMAINSSLDSLFELIDNFERAVPREKVGGVVRVVAPHAYASRYVQRHSSEFLKLHPDIELKIEACSPPQVAEMVADGEADLGITDSMVLRKGVQYEPLKRTSVCCVLPQGHVLAERSQVKLEDLRSECFIRISSAAITPDIDKLFLDEGMQARIRVTTSDHVAACHFISEGLGVALMNPLTVPDVFAERVATRPFTPELTCQLSYALPTEIPMSWQARSFMTALSMGGRR
jgi:DNA-binding transcriptional LysR family regulator